MRNLTLLLLSVFLTTSSAAAETADPRFYIEEIVVEGTRHTSDKIIVSESLLDTGESYSEDDLHDAVDRIRRLPFLLDVDFELLEGSGQGRHVLVIEALETTRLFFATSLERRTLADDADSFDSDDFGGDLQAGYRLFVGDTGLLFASVGDFGAQVGYTAYDFLNKNAFFNVTLANSALCCQADGDFLSGNIPEVSFRDENESLSVTLGIPISARRMWRIDARHSRSDFGSSPRIGDALVAFTSRDLRRSELRGSWLQDTTDDPVFPRRGDEIVASTTFAVNDSKKTEAFDFTTFSFLEISDDVSSRSLGVEVGGRRYWPIGRRQSLAAGLVLAAGRTDFDPLVFEGESFDRSVDSWSARVSLRHALELAGGNRAQPRRRLRWENGVEYRYQELSDDFGQLPSSWVRFSSALVYRSRWGVFRLAMQVVDFLESS